MKEKIFATWKQFVTSDHEFSKRFTVSIRNFMFGHVAISLIACIALAFFCIDTTSIVDLLTAMMPVYIALQGANYVKSGFENVKKISTSAESASDEESDDG